MPDAVADVRRRAIAPSLSPPRHRAAALDRRGSVGAEPTVGAERPAGFLGGLLAAGVSGLPSDGVVALSRFVVCVAVGALLGAARPAPAEADAARALIEIEGNVVLVDEVYLAVIALPPHAQATPASAVLVARQVLGFLRRAGYALARVEAVAKDGRIHLEIDEGRLSRVVVKGRDLLTSLAVRLQITLPYDVFNRPQLERMLAQYRAGGRTVRYRLTPARQVADEGFQLDPRTLVPGAAPLPSTRGSYELLIDFSGGAPRGGLSFVAEVSPDSILAGGELSGYAGIVAGDKWEIEAQVGAEYFEDLEREADELRFSRVFGDARWLAPAGLGGKLRPSLRGREDLIRRQRRDLGVESYWWNRLEGALGLTVEPGRGLELTAELGVQQRDLFGIQQLAGAVPLGASSALVWFTALSGRYVLDPDNPRLDRRHRVALDARQSVATDEARDPFWLIDASYRRAFELGWNEVLVRGAASALAGDFEIADAIPLTSRYLRGVFGSELYLDRAVALSLEYHQSLQRDLFKVGVFVNGAALREATGSPAAGAAHLGTSFGPTFHALILDVMQLDLSYAFGFLDDGAFDYGMTFDLSKAF